MVEKKKSSKETYVKYHMKRNPQTLRFLIKDGKPVAGEYIRKARITDEQAFELNKWDGVKLTEDDVEGLSGYMWVKAKKAESTKAQDEKAALVAELQVFFDEGKLDKMPHVATGVPKLTELLTKLKEA